MTTPPGTPLVTPPQQPQAARTVEVFYPSSAPHLAPLASKIQTTVEREMGKLFGDPSRAMGVFSVADAARSLAAFARFRAALGERIGSNHPRE